MEQVKTEGIIISEVNTGEADKSITIFTRDLGKIYAYARNARKYKGRINAAVDFLSYGEFILYRRRDSYSVSSFELNESFFAIRKDMKKLTYAAHMADVLKFAVQEEQPSVKLLRLFLNTLHYLAADSRPLELLCSIFELRALSISGFAPQPYTTCVSCGAILESEENRILFSYSECGFICGKCKKNGTPASSILIDTAHAVCHIVTSESKALFNFGVSSQVSSELAKLSGRYLRERLDYDFKKLDMIKDL